MELMVQVIESHFYSILRPKICKFMKTSLNGWHIILCVSITRRSGREQIPIISFVFRPRFLGFVGFSYFIFIRFIT